jgi:Domain of unknown function (DUF4872)/Butirosin biosynthesis protein H, N-terminal
MTRQRDFKALVRERMQKTGERYSAARAQLLHKPAARSAPLVPGLLRGYSHFGGTQSGTSALGNVLAHAGIRSSVSGRPFTEVEVNGICGGPGVLYAVFEYKGWPPILSLALQSRSMPDAFVAAGIARLRLRTSVHETTSRTAAKKALDDALAAGSAALCVVDIASLPWYGLPTEFIGGGPHVVGIAGRDGSDYWLDDRSSHPRRVDAGVLADARAAYKAARSRLITVDGAEPGADARQSMIDAIADTALRYVEPAVPKSFWSNCGFSGLSKWRSLLTDRKDKKGWPTIFADGARACAGLQRAYDAIECQVAPGAGRGFYAAFLDQAATTLDRPALAAAAVAYRDAGAAWSKMAALIAGAPDAALRDSCVLADRRLELGDDAASAPKESAALWSRRLKLADACRLSASQALEIYAGMSQLLGAIIDAERAAVEAMSEVAVRA